MQLFCSFGASQQIVADDEPVHPKGIYKHHNQEEDVDNLCYTYIYKSSQQMTFERLVRSYVTEGIILHYIHFSFVLSLVVYDHIHVQL